MLHGHLHVYVCRYVNGADPNRRRLSYKGMADAVAAPLKHWHLLGGMPACWAKTRHVHQLPYLPALRTEVSTSQRPDRPGTSLMWLLPQFSSGSVFGLFVNTRACCASQTNLFAWCFCLAGSPRLLHQLPDTVAFLQLLRLLAAPPGSPQDGLLPPALQASAAAAAAAGQELPEIRAARVLFRWVCCLFLPVSARTQCLVRFMMKRLDLCCQHQVKDSSGAVAWSQACAGWKLSGCQALSASSACCLFAQVGR